MLEKIKYYFDIRKELEDFDYIHTEIEKSVVFKGTNLWILVFAIIIASVGLNTNSTAVIIGAMLISPLMGPINGIGYSIATYNYQLFQKSLKNFLFAVVTSLVASTVYFAISPVSYAHSELLARTSPTIYDVLIALFGGLAGIVALSSKLKGNVIPGVAIATALMPPLCTAGYGLATGQFPYFFGALYLFTINTVFIAISSVLVSQFFNFPILVNIESSKKKKINQIITIVILLTLLPSIYFGYQLVLNEKFNESANQFVKNVTVFEGNYLLKHEINPSNKSIHLVYGGNELSESAKKEIQKKKEIFNLSKSKISVEQGFSMDLNGNSEIEMLKGKLSASLFNLEKKKVEIDSLKNKPLIAKQLLREIKPLFPDVNSCAYAESIVVTDTSQVLNPISFVWISSSSVIDVEEKKKVKAWLKARLNVGHLKVFYN